MAVQDLSTITNQYQKHFNKKFLVHAEHELRLNEFALQADLPKNVGSKTITFFRPDTANAANVVELTEGTPINVFTSRGLTPLDAVLKQFGQASKITDIVTMTALFDMLQQNIRGFGEDCALHHDTHTRNVLCHATTGLTKMYAQGKADFDALVDADLEGSKLVGADLLRGATKLKQNKTPRINGKYVAILPPEIAYDIMRDGDFLDTAKYSNAEALYKGEIGSLWGVRCVEATNPFTEDETEGTFASVFNGAGDNTLGFIYTSIILGRDAFGTPKLAGTQSPSKPSVIINNKPDKSDPLNQFMTAGWKSFWIAVILNAAFGVAMRSRSNFKG